MGLFNSTHAHRRLRYYVKLFCVPRKQQICTSIHVLWKELEQFLSKISSPHTSRWNRSVTFTLMAAEISISAFFSVLANREGVKQCYCMFTQSTELSTFVLYCNMQVMFWEHSSKCDTSVHTVAYRLLFRFKNYSRTVKVYIMSE